MKRIRETLARLTRANRRESREEASLRLDKVGRTSTTQTISERGFVASDGSGPIILFDGIQKGEEGVDIIFVHGLYGHRVGTWTKGAICWPRDFLGHDVKNTRVIAFGYTSALGASGNVFSEQAERLLTDITRVRIGTSRPIIFVGHGLGGLVIKEALVTAAMSRIYGSHTELGNIYPRTVGVIFLGTPHTGSGRRSVGDYIALTALMSMRPPNNRLLGTLQESSGFFENQHNTFLMISRDIQVVCVREELPTESHIVPASSVLYEAFNVTRENIPANHNGMAKYASTDDLGYLKLVAHIKKLSSGPTPYELEKREERNQEVLSALYFDTVYERDDRIDEAYGETCEWILSPEISPLRSFLKSHDPVLWISGRAGCGKSTLMKHAFHSEKVRQELAEGWARGGDLMMASVFFFEGGDQIQKSYEGLLRSVLFQILSPRPELIKVAFPSFFHGPWPPPDAPFNTVTNLNQGFYSLFSHMSDTMRLCVFMDGLDEFRITDRKYHYSEDDIDLSYDRDTGDESWGTSKWVSDSRVEVSRLVNSMGNKDTFKMVVSSRELPVFVDAFHEVPRIQVQDHTEASIAQYIAGRLDAEAPGLPDTIHLCQEIAEKSSGDILWARLAVDMVLEGSLRTLRITLDSLPTQLGGPEGLYMRMLENMSPDAQYAACRIFHLVSRSQQPPSLIKLAFADEGYIDSKTNTLMAIGVSGKSQTQTVEDLREISDQMQQRLRTCCAGLLEAEEGPVEAGQRVVFMHQTAKEWVGRKDVWHKLPGIPPSPIDTVELDLSLLSGCIRHLKGFEALHPPVSAWPDVRFRPEAWLLIANALRYAARVDHHRATLGPYCQLLDELDRTNSAAWVRSLQNHKPLYDDPDWYAKKCPALCRKHWAGYEPMEAGKPPKRKDFLSLAVQASLVNYVSAKLRALPADARRMKSQELLPYVVSPKAEGFSACVSLSGDYMDFHHDMPDSRLLDVLFAAGADENDREDGGLDKAWLKVLKTGRRFFSHQGTTMSHLMESGTSSLLIQNRERWVAAVKALLKRGANPYLEVEISSGTGERHSTVVMCAVDLIRETLGGEPEYAVELNQMEILMGRRASLGIAQ